MNNWHHISESLWTSVLTRVKALKAEGETLQAIADKVGVNHRSVVGEWIKGNRQAANAAMGDLMTYAERLGIDYRHYFPGGEPPAQELPDCAACKKLLAKDRENQKLQREVERLRQELAEEKTRSKTLDGVIDKLVTNANSGQAGRQKPGPAESKIAG